MAIGERVSGTGLEVTLKFSGLATGFESDVQLHLPWAVPACRVSLAGVVAFETALQAGGVAGVTRAGFADTLEDLGVEHARPPQLEERIEAMRSGKGVPSYAKASEGIRLALSLSKRSLMAGPEADHRT